MDSGLVARWRELVGAIPPGIGLVAVSKGHPESSIRCLALVGQIDFGESRLQEALPKIEALNDLKFIRWHFIGHIQSNKIRRIVRSFAVIHSVDSFLLAERISRIAAEEKCCPEIMLQVKLRTDPSKGGFRSDELLELWPRLIDLPNLKMIGLMTIAPMKIGLEERKQLFKNCRQLADELDLQHCSMGMSQDWEQALEAGATWLRLGSVLFGTRRNDVSLRRDITKVH